MACGWPKISHIDEKVVEDIIRQLERFGKEGPLTNTQGKVLEHWRMTMDYTTARKLKMLMYEYIDKMLTKSSKYMNGRAKPPAADHWFNTKTTKKTPKYQCQVCHHLVAKLRYLSRRTYRWCSSTSAVGQTFPGTTGNVHSHYNNLPGK